MEQAGSSYWDRTPTERDANKNNRKHKDTRQVDEQGRTRGSKKKRQRQAQLGRDDRTETITAARGIPTTTPTRDKHSRRLQNGKRPSWYTGFRAAYLAAHAGTPYAMQARGGCSADLEIDHIQGWREEIIGYCSETEVCDGTHHWTAYLLTDTLNHTHPISRDNSRANPDAVGAQTAIHHEENLQILCGHHNGHKNGRKDLDAIQPEYAGSCPNPGGNCGL